MTDTYVYSTLPDEYDGLTVVDQNDWDLFHMFTGAPLKSDWRPIRVKVLPHGERGDFPHLATHVPVVTPRALAALDSLIANDVEALPLQCDEGEFIALNVLDIVDCLDETQSEIERFSDDTVMYINRYEFEDGCTDGRHMFKVRGAELYEVLVSEQFKRAVGDTQLRGLDFRTASVRRFA